MIRRYCALSLLLVLCLVAGCSRSATKEAGVRESGMPSFVLQNDPAGCDCVPVVERFARAELGLDPTKFGHWQTPTDLLALLKTESANNGGEVVVRSVNKCLDELEARPETGSADAVLLIHPKGHVYLLLGTVMIGDVLTYQIIHGESAVWLIDKTTLERARFAEVWQFKTKAEGIPIAVGNGALTIDRHYVNFGKVLPSTTLETVVLFKNTGEKPLVFTKPEVTCRCTVAEGLADSELAPGDSREMKLSFQTSAGSSERHPVFVKVFEKGTGLSNRIEIVLMASQQQSMMIEPMSLDFGKVVKGETYERTINITEVPTDRFSILAITSENQPIRGTFESSSERGGLKTYRIKVLFTPDENSPVPLGKVFTIETDSLLRPKVPIPYGYSVLPDVFVEPSIISLGNVEVGTMVKKSFLIMARNENELQCKVVSIPVNCKVAIVQNGNPTELSFQVAPRELGVWQGKLIIEFKTSEREGVLEIDCVGYVR